MRSGSGTPPNNTAVFLERDEGQVNDSLEPNETTGIVMKGPNRSAPSAMNYQSTVTSESNGARPRRNGSMPQSNTGRRRETANGGTDANGDEHHDHDKEAVAWWKAQLAKFGSIELENKGSVARDHLALGWLPLLLLKSPRPKGKKFMLTRVSWFIINRKDISRLVEDVPFFCFYRHRCHTAIPAEYLAHKDRQCKRSHITTTRETTWCDFSGHQHIDVVLGLPQVFSSAAMDYQGQIPRKQRHCDIGVISGAGFDGDISVR